MAGPIHSASISQEGGVSAEDHRWLSQASTRGFSEAGKPVREPRQNAASAKCRALVHRKPSNRALPSKTSLHRPPSCLPSGIDVTGRFPMAIDFRLTSHQRKLQLESREFAADMLGNARAAELLPTPEERFRATKPIYEAMVAAGFFAEVPSSLSGR